MTLASHFLLDYVQSFHFPISFVSFTSYMDTSVCIAALFYLHMYYISKNLNVYK